MRSEEQFKNVLFRYWREGRLPEYGIPDLWWQDGIYEMDGGAVRWNSGEKQRVTLDDGDELRIVARVPCDSMGNIRRQDLWDVDEEIDELVEVMKPDGQLR